jgi:hypothetical protein
LPPGPEGAGGTADEAADEVVDGAADEVVDGTAGETGSAAGSVAAGGPADVVVEFPNQDLGSYHTPPRIFLLLLTFLFLRIVTVLFDFLGILLYYNRIYIF